MHGSTRLPGGQGADVCSATEGFAPLPSRRQFVKTSAAAAAVIAATGLSRLARAQSTAAGGKKPDEKAAGSAAKPGGKTLLILGGTAFLGPEVVEAAQAKGWTITLFNRGKTRPNLFPDLEKLHGDRDPKKGEGLKALEGRTWDYVVDTSGYYPRMVKASAELLKDHCKRYAFVSSVSVYKNDGQGPQDESAEVGTIPDPTVETMGEQMQNYGPLKALCEQAAEAAMPGRALNIRPGYIVGPGDWSGRFNYWPLRIREAGKKDASSKEVLAPGTPDDPVQYVDVRDLAEFIVHALDTENHGVFNVLGPTPSDKPARWGDTLEACKRVTQSDCKFTWVDAEFLKEHADPEKDYFPIWLPATGETSGFHRRSNMSAVKAGLKFRPVDDTIGAFLKWYDALKPEQQQRYLAGTPRERELELLKMWNERKKG